jgi:hypothetical protein
MNISTKSDKHIILSGFNCSNTLCRENNIQEDGEATKAEEEEEEEENIRERIINETVVYNIIWSHHRLSRFILSTLSPHSSALSNNTVMVLIKPIDTSSSFWEFLPRKYSSPLDTK